MRLESRSPSPSERVQGPSCAGRDSPCPQEAERMGTTLRGRVCRAGGRAVCSLAGLVASGSEGSLPPMEPALPSPTPSSCSRRLLREKGEDTARVEALTAGLHLGCGAGGPSLVWFIKKGGKRTPHFLPPSEVIKFSSHTRDCLFPFLSSHAHGFFTRSLRRWRSIALISGSKLTPEISLCI